MSKLVSIIIPTFNRVSVLSDTLNSILCQDYLAWECIIIDDGSKPEVEELVLKFIEKDNRFHFYKRPQNRIKGANACRNYGFSKSRGDYIKWFDSDDIMHPNFIKNQVEILDKNKTLDFCICLADSFIVGEIKKNVYYANRNPTNDKLTAYLTKNHYFFTASPLWRKSFLLDKELFDEDLTDSQETDFHFKILSHKCNYIYTNEILFSIRRGHNSITQNINNQKSSNLSRLKFFIKAFTIVKFNDNVDDKKLLLNYILYRQLILFNYLCLHKMRLISINFYFKCLKNIFNTDNKFVHKIDLFKAVSMSLFIRKGYKTIRKYKIDIIENIEN